MNKEIEISPRQIAKAIQDLLDKNELLQDKIYKLEDRINKVIEYIENDKYEYTPMGITNKPINKELLEILKGGNE